MSDSRKVCFFFKKIMLIAQIFTGEYRLPLPPAVSSRLCEADTTHIASSGGSEDASLASDPSSWGFTLAYCGKIVATNAWSCWNYLVSLRTLGWSRPTSLWNSLFYPSRELLFLSSSYLSVASCRFNIFGNKKLLSELIQQVFVNMCCMW